MGVVISIIVVIVLVAAVVSKSMYDFKLKNDAKISFKHTFKKTGTPIVTLKDRNGRSFNFLVDTGSNASHLKLGIVEVAADAERVIPLGSDGKAIENAKVTTANGEVDAHGYYRLTLFHNDKMFIEVFEVMDLTSALSGWGVEIHGILGSVFLEKYKYVLDFEDKTMFIK